MVNLTINYIGVFYTLQKNNKIVFEIKPESLTPYHYLLLPQKIKPPEFFDTVVRFFTVGTEKKLFFFNNEDILKETIDKLTDFSSIRLYKKILQRFLENKNLFFEKAKNIFIGFSFIPYEAEIGKQQLTQMYKVSPYKRNPYGKSFYQKLSGFLDPDGVPFLADTTDDDPDYDFDHSDFLAELSSLDGSEIYPNLNKKFAKKWKKYFLKQNAYEEHNAFLSNIEPLMELGWIRVSKTSNFEFENYENWKESIKLIVDFLIGIKFPKNMPTICIESNDGKFRKTYITLEELFELETQPYPNP